MKVFPKNKLLITAVVCQHLIPLSLMAEPKEATRENTSVRVSKNDPLLISCPSKTNDLNLQTAVGLQILKDSLVLHFHNGTSETLKISDVIGTDKDGCIVEPNYVNSIKD